MRINQEQLSVQRRWAFGVGIQLLLPGAPLSAEHLYVIVGRMVKADAEPVLPRARSSVSHLLYFDKTRVERRSASHVGEAFGSQGIDANAVGHQL